MLSPSLEDYLEEAYRLQLNGDIRLSDIAVRLEVSLPSAVRGLRRLSDLGYLIYAPYENVKLTPLGKKAGEFLVERNKVLQNFFSLLDTGADPVKEAEAVEHYLSNSTVNALDTLNKFLLENPLVYKQYYNFCRISSEKKERLLSFR